MIRTLAPLLLATLTFTGATRAQGPTITPWAGTSQAFGQIGNPQRWVNVLGTVTDPDGVKSLSYTLNGGASKALSIGPDTRRLLEPGDFNIDIDRADLVAGNNTVRITAVDQLNNQSALDVTVHYTAGKVWPKTYTADWSLASNVRDLAQVVDGKWFLDQGNVRPQVMGYDRTFVIGDVTWQSFEVKMPITILAIDPKGFVFPSVSPGLGFTARWIGHTQRVANEQPLTYWLPQGGGPWYDAGEELLYLAGSDGMFVLDPDNRKLPLAVKHWWKLRAETLPSGRTFYGLKIWKASETEPELWQMHGSEGTDDLQNGSLIVVAHHVDARFGKIEITSLDDDVTQPLIRNVQVTPNDTTALVSFDTDEPTKSVVSYGQTTSYETGTVGNTELKVEHTLTLTGLAPDRTYHFQIAVEDGRGNPTTSTDDTFHTQGSSTIPPSTFATDEFNSSVIDDKVWAFFDPLNDSTVSMTGTQLRLWTPGTAIHDVWTQSNTLPRVMRAAPDTDFEVDVKFDSSLTKNFQSQGVLVQESPTRVLRIEFHYVTGGTKVFIASLFDGVANIELNQAVSLTAPMILRVNRSGNVWTVLYSLDGTNFTVAKSFTKAMTVTSVGVYAGNSNYDHTVLVDWFKVSSVGNPDTTPPVISNVAVTPGITSATVTWTTDEPATSSVSYGTTNAYEIGSEGATQLVTSHQVELTGLSPETLHHFKVSSSDKSSNQASSGDATFTTKPGIKFHWDEFTGSTLDPAWTFQNPTGVATLTMTGSHVRVAIPDSDLTHDIWTNSDMVPKIRQPAPDSDFDIIAKFSSALSSSFTSQGILIEQSPTEVLRIEFLNVSNKPGLLTASLFGSSAKIYTLSEFALSTPMYLRVKRVGSSFTVFYSFDGQNWTVGSQFDKAMTVSAISLYGGSSAHTPHAILIDRFYEFGAPDTFPPVISDIVSSVSNTAAMITWTTDEPATSRVEYGLTTTYGLSVESTKLTTTHAVLVPNLNADQVYHFRVVSKDSVGNTQNSADHTFHTEAGVTLESDDFNSPSLDLTRWEFVNPLGDTSTAMTGTQAVISTTSATAIHDVWTNINTLPRLRQAAPDTDFEVTAKFDTGLLGSFQSHGFLIEQDDLHVLRAEYLTLAGEPHFLVAEIFGDSWKIHTLVPVNITTPSYLKVKRAGSDFTVYRSADAITWTAVSSFTKDMVVKAISIHAGTDIYTARTLAIDWFSTVPSVKPTAIESDDFKATELGKLWTFENPLNDASLTMTGTQAKISIPATNDIHDVWTGINTLPRIMQAAPDTNFEIEAKFESSVTKSFQSQGILIQQSPTDVIRIELHYLNGATNVFAATIFGTSARIRVFDPIALGPTSYLRVKRTGDSWTIKTSNDGVTFTEAVTFTQAMTVTAVGVYAGSGAGVAHQAVIDYFFETSSPIVPEDG